MKASDLRIGNIIATGDPTNKMTWNIGTYGRTIYYVHDFQNLFYSLHGVELSVPLDIADIA